MNKNLSSYQTNIAKQKTLILSVYVSFHYHYRSERHLNFTRGLDCIDFLRGLTITLYLQQTSVSCSNLVPTVSKLVSK